MGMLAYIGDYEALTDMHEIKLQGLFFLDLYEKFYYPPVYNFSEKKSIVTLTEFTRFV